MRQDYPFADKHIARHLRAVRRRSALGLAQDAGSFTTYQQTLAPEVQT